jgi:5-bromo-4-chloroindolyl phosphate hydrolysis protein
MMYKFLTVIVRILIAIPVMFATWLVSFFAFEQTFFNSSVISLVGAALTYWLSSITMYFRYLKKNHLSMKEYRYIRKNLAEAKRKIRRIQKALLAIRNMSFLKNIMELLRIIRKIYGVTKKEPKRFYQGEKFYFSHLDSAVELTEKYALLSSQPKKNSEVEQALYLTRNTIKELKLTVENDLYHILSDDIDQLHFEIDVAKYSTNTIKKS